jgi:hypothetical protein
MHCQLTAKFSQEISESPYFAIICSFQRADAFGKAKVKGNTPLRGKAKVKSKKARQKPGLIVNTTEIQ